MFFIILPGALLTQERMIVMSLQKELDAMREFMKDSFTQHSYESVFLRHQLVQMLPIFLLLGIIS
jgi:hypothetical protein